MDNLIEFLRTDNFLLIIAIIMILLVLGFIIVLLKLASVSNKYKNFMKKLGNGKDIEEDLENYMYRVERKKKQNNEIVTNINNIEQDLTKCIQKVGIVRYNAFKDTGSDLSFALALLDENNDGVVLNGIYSREMSNIYAKQKKKGKSSYSVSEEEQKAIEKAINSDNIYKMR